MSWTIAVRDELSRAVIHPKEVDEVILGKIFAAVAGQNLVR